MKPKIFFTHPFHATATNWITSFAPLYFENLWVSDSSYLFVLLRLLTGRKSGKFLLFHGTRNFDFLRYWYLRKIHIGGSDNISTCSLTLFPSLFLCVRTNFYIYIYNNKRKESRTSAFLFLFPKLSFKVKKSLGFSSGIKSFGY